MLPSLIIAQVQVIPYKQPHYPWSFLEILLPLARLSFTFHKANVNQTNDEANYGWHNPAHANAKEW